MIAKNDTVPKTETACKTQLPPTTQSLPRTAAPRRAPGLKQIFPLPYGPFRKVVGDPLGFYSHMREEYGDVVRWDFGRSSLHFLFHPDHVQHVLQDQWKNYPHSKFYDLIKLVTGEGLLTSEGEEWRRDRRMIQPAFHRDQIRRFATVVCDLTAKMLARWERHADSGKTVDISQEMMRLTLGVISQALFSRDISEDSDAMGEAMTTALEYLTYRINHPFALPVWAPTPVNRRFRRAKRYTDRLVDDIIRQRRSSSSSRHDMLSMLLAAQDEESGTGMSDQRIRDQVATFLGAGHETSAVALTWTWALLSRHPQARRQAEEEVDRVLGGRTPTFEDLAELDYLRRVFLESMRLFPSGWGTSRAVAADDEIGGYSIPGKSLVIVSQYVTHRHPDFWENPEGFDPDRFTPERMKNRPKYAYFPFSGGPRKCIGDQFAMMEAQLILAMVLQKHRLDLAPNHHLTPEAIFTLRPQNGMPMKIHTR